MTTPTVYVICDQNCKFEGMTKEQILTAIMQAVEGGEIKDVDTGFITTIKTINGVPLKFFVGEQAVYDELSDDDKENLFAIITNDTTKEGLFAAIKQIEDNIESLTENQRTLLEYKRAIESGEKSVPKAGSALYDASGRSISYEYMRLTDRKHFTGDPINGVDFLSRTSGGDGDIFLVSWEAYGTRNISFGLMWWDGEETTYSAITRIGGKNYAVKFENNGYPSGDGSAGLATIVEFDANGQPSTLTVTGTTLRLICLRNEFVPE